MKLIYSIIIVIAAVLFQNNSYGQKTFLIENASLRYSAKLTVERCKDGLCGGSGTIEIYEKNNLKSSQVFRSEDLYFPIDEAKLANKVILLDTDETPLIFDDFNFDGIQDLAIPNGSGGYNMGSYDVYVYSTAKKQFIKNQDLTDIASNQGLFQIDHKRKRLIAYSKSGCCWHQTTEYAIVPKKGVVKVYDKVEDGAKVDNIVIVTEQKLLNGKWSKTTKRYKIKDYYKN